MTTGAKLSEFAPAEAAPFPKTGRRWLTVGAWLGQTPHGSRLEGRCSGWRVSASLDSRYSDKAEDFKFVCGSDSPSPTSS
jgi:hypothetical protein